MDISNDIDKLIKNIVKRGVSIEELHSKFNNRINIFERNIQNKKMIIKGKCSRKTKSIICRPVLFISDSSNDEG